MTQRDEPSELGTCLPHGSLPSPLHSTFCITNFLSCFHKIYCTEDLGLESYYPPQLSFGQLGTRIIHTLGKVGCGARGPASGIFYRGDKTPELDKNSW